MDFNHIAERLSKNNCNEADKEDVNEFVRATAAQVAAQLKRNDDQGIKIVDLIKGLNAVLTNGSYEIRCRGLELMAQVVKALPTSLLTEKEIEVMTEFICLRLIDHKSMELPALECLSYFVDCNNKPARYNKLLIEFIKNKANIHKMEARTRRRVYELLKKLVAERKRLSNTMDCDFIYSLVTILEGENNPDNLMLCFGMISFILKNFDDLDPFIDDIFEWLTSYYPIDYTPSDEKAEKEGEVNIQRLDLVEALYECFYANPLNSENLQALLLEKLESNVMSTKLESLECLIKCYEKLTFPLASIVKYNSTLWTALRMNCLRKIESVEPRLLETSLKTLSCLAKRLSSDDADMYLTFISDMYEELAIAFRKPEMDLFEPAARLVTHAILPKVAGFNYVLDKVLPIALNALDANEQRPLSGLAYIFEKLHQQHPDAELKDDLNEFITKLALKVTDLLGTTDDASTCRLLVALLSQRVPLSSDDSLNKIISKLCTKFKDAKTPIQVTLEVEKCLALVCTKYTRFDIITKSEVKDPEDINALVRLIYDFDIIEPATAREDISKFPIYLRLLIIELSKSTCVKLDALNQLVLLSFLARLREQLELIDESIAFCQASKRICEQSAIIHAIIVNKLSNVDRILMTFFSSSFCQNLVSAAQAKEQGKDSSSSGNCLTLTTYLPHVKWIFKSLVIRNHQLATPLVNLILNCITSPKVHPDVAREASLVFSFVLAPLSDDSLNSNGNNNSNNAGDDEILFSAANHYKVFSLYKQKFYMQTAKEARLRYEQLSAEKKTEDNHKATTGALLIFAIVSQLAHLPLAVYKRDHEWLIRQILRVLSPSYNGAMRQQASGGGERADLNAQEPPTSALFQAIYSCLEGLIHRDLCDGLVPFLPSLIDLNIKNAQEASSLVIRRQALLCLAKIATTFKETDLQVYRSGVVDKLRVCLADKKRLVRQAAGETRLRWVAIGQPIGS